MNLYRAIEEFDEGTSVSSIFIQEVEVLKETKHTYLLKVGFRKTKRIFKSTMSYAQLTKKESLESLIKRRERNISWFKARTRWANEAIELAKEKLLEVQP